MTIKRKLNSPILFVCFVLITFPFSPAVAQDVSIEQHIDTTFASILKGKSNRAMVVGVINGEEKNRDELWGRAGYWGDGL